MKIALLRKLTIVLIFLIFQHQQKIYLGQAPLQRSEFSNHRARLFCS